VDWFDEFITAKSRPGYSERGGAVSNNIVSCSALPDVVLHDDCVGTEDFKPLKSLPLLRLHESAAAIRRLSTSDETKTIHKTPANGMFKESISMSS
jgi:hypothetical protein